MKKSVKIGELKAHLSQYLRIVKSGETVVIYDRNEPVAQITRYEKSVEELAKGLVVIPAKRPLSDLDKMDFGPPVDIDWDSVPEDLKPDRIKR